MRNLQPARTTHHLPAKAHAYAWQAGSRLTTHKAVFFEFEADFAEDGIRCIPMIVRFKLDACGIKLKLAEWSRMTEGERAHLADVACETMEEVRRFRDTLCEFIVQRTGNTPTPIPVQADPAWARRDQIPDLVVEKMQEMSIPPSLSRWQQLSDLQRFALLKLSQPGHENRNFPKAVEEFGWSKLVIRN